MKNIIFGTGSIGSRETKNNMDAKIEYWAQLGHFSEKPRKNKFFEQINF